MLGTVFGLEGWVGLLVYFVLAVVAVVAFVSSLLYPAETYEVAGKLTKTTWCVVLALAVAVEILGANLNLLKLFAVVVPLVYLVDVRPALAGLHRR